MPTTGDWIQGPDVEAPLMGPTQSVAWVRTKGSPPYPSWDAISGDSWGTYAGDVFYGHNASKPAQAGGIQASGDSAFKYGVHVQRKVGVETFPNIDPGDWPAGAIGIEYEVGGGTYSGFYDVVAKWTIDAAVSIESEMEVRTITPGTPWPDAAAITSGQFPARSELTTWVTRDVRTKLPSFPPLFLAEVAWSQPSPDVTWALIPEEVWALDVPVAGQNRNLWFHHASTTITRTYSPPRHRFIFGDATAGYWTTRQRQTAGGNAGGWPLRQRHNGGHSGSWPLRQRQTGL